MPNIKQSQRIDRSRLSPMPQPSAADATTSAVPAPPMPTVPSPMMMCPMPTVAASFDTYSRQFYGRSVNPQQRILPVGL